MTTAYRLLVCTILTLPLLFGGRVCAAECPPGLEGVPEVVAEVDGKRITREALVRELVGSGAAGAIERLVRRMVTEQAARAANVTVTPAEIEQEFAVDRLDLMAELVRPMWDWDKRYKEFPIGDIIQARFRMTVDEYKQSVVRQKLLIRKCVTQDLKLTDRDLMDVFNANKEFFQPPVKYRASHILFSPFDPMDLHRSLTFRSSAGQMEAIRSERDELVEDTTGARRRRIELWRDHGIDLGNAPSIDRLSNEWQRSRDAAERALRELRQGVLSWDQAVRKHTQDPKDHPNELDASGRRISVREKLKLPPGDVGWFHSRGPLVHEFYEGAKDLKPNEICGTPVRTQYGWHLIKMIEIQRQPVMTFDQCRPRVERLYIEKEVQVRSYKWITGLVNRARLNTERVLLWPPVPPAPVLGIAAPQASPGDPDPVIGSVNGAPLRRSDVWRELVRSEADEALERLLNLEIIMGILKTSGLERLEWDAANPQIRPAQPPEPHPISVKPEEIDLALNEDRLRLDALNQEHRKQGLPEAGFGDYIYERYGQTVSEYRRVIEAGLILQRAIRQRVPADEKTLQLQFALAREIYNHPVWYEISHILIVPNGGMENKDPVAQLDARRIAEELRRSYAAGGVNFGDMVRTWSMDSAANKANNGRLPPCYPEERAQFDESGLFYAEINKQNLEAGQISSVIQSGRGCHLIRVDRIHPARKADFEETRAQVERDYLNEQAKLYTDIWLRALKNPGRVKSFLKKPWEESSDAVEPSHLPLPEK